jgi:hypothetical protein
MEEDRILFYWWEAIASMIQEYKGDLSSEHDRQVIDELFDRLVTWHWACRRWRECERCLCHKTLDYLTLCTGGDSDPFCGIPSDQRPKVFVSWNVRCPVHGFPENSTQYRKGITAGEGWDLWLPRWKELMAAEKGRG